MPAFQGTLLLTGANGGIATGFVTQFLKSPFAASYKGYYAVRDPGRADSLRATLKSHATGHHEHEIATLDLSSLENVRKAAADINERVAKGSLPPIRALVLNAGTQDFHQQLFSEDEIERTFAVNYLHNFLLTLLLLNSMDKQHGRIIVIGSTSIDPYWWPNKDNYTTEEQKTLFTTVDQLVKGESVIEDNMKAGSRRYAKSKLCIVMFMFELQKRLDIDPHLSSISILALDPGWVSTDIVRNAPPVIKWMMWSLQWVAAIFSFFKPNHVVRSAAKTGDDLVRVCFDTDAFGEFPKAMYIDGSEVGKVANDQAKDEENWAKLWEGSLKYAGVKDGDTVLEEWR